MKSFLYWLTRLVASFWFIVFLLFFPTLGDTYFFFIPIVIALGLLFTRITEGISWPYIPLLVSATGVATAFSYFGVFELGCLTYCSLGGPFDDAAVGNVLGTTLAVALPIFYVSLLCLFSVEYKQTRNKFIFINIAASTLVFIGVLLLIGFYTFQFFITKQL